MNEKVFLLDLIEKARKVAVESFGYKQSNMRHYGRYWNDLSCYFAYYRFEVFSEQLAEQYICDKKQQRNIGKIAASTFRTIRRVVYLLKDCFTNENITWKRFKNSITMKLNEPTFIKHHECYVHQLKNEQKSIGTIKEYSRISKGFLEYLDIKRYKNISEVTLCDVNAFIIHISNRFPKGMHVVLPVLRSFFHFLEFKEKTTSCLIWAVPNDPRRKISIVSGVTSNETRKLLETFDRNDSLGKRDYAIFLLAARTGLRRSDISNLRLSDIKWRTSAIELVQKKTNSLLVLPLLTDVGNAIAEFKSYIEGLVELKHAIGYSYKTQEFRLWQFERFFTEKYTTEINLTKEVTMHWAQRNDDEHVGSLGSRISPVRQLAKYMNGIGVGAYIISNGIPGKKNVMSLIYLPVRNLGLFLQKQINAVMKREVQ